MSHRRTTAILLLALFAPLASGVRADEPEPEVAAERFVFLVDGGPVIVDLRMTLDGQPYREAREQLVDDYLAMADSDGDGKPTWGEAILNPRFPAIAVRRPGQAQGGFAGQAPGFDANGDEVVDRSEMHAVLERLGGAVLQYTADRSRVPATRTDELLDADGDGRVTEADLVGVFARLKSFDANDDDVLDRAELQVAGNPYQQGGATNGSDVDVVRVVEEIDTATLFQRLRTRYAKPMRFVTREDVPLDPALFDRLDANANGRLDVEEGDAFLTVPAHLELRVNIGSPAARPIGVTIVRARAPFDTAALEREGASASFDAVLPTTAFAVSTNQDRTTFNYTQTATALLMRADGDSNGYLDKKELTDNPQGAFLLRQFDMWDANEDGKVYVEEIAAAYDRQQAPRQTQVVLTVGRRESTMFDLLDANADGRLGLREMRDVRKRIALRDTNADGVLQPHEVPGQFTVGFGRFGSVPVNNGVQRFGVGGVRPSTPTTNTANGPRWFVHADVNRDGDLSPREFLGTPEQFRTLDANGDGFVDRAEADATK